MTFAVLVARSPYASPSTVTWFFLCACLASGILAWCASASTSRDLVHRLMRASAVIVAVYIVWDCGWLPDWLCGSF